MKTNIHPIYFEDHSFQHLTAFLKAYKDHRILVLVDENTKVYTLRKGIKDTVVYDEKGFEKEFSHVAKHIWSSNYSVVFPR